jgi:glucose/arabinose dehydrogenase
MAMARFSFIILAAALTALCQIPNNARLTAVFGTIRFDRAVWMGEIPGKKGHFLVAEQGSGATTDSARLWVIQPQGNSHSKTGFAGFRVKRGMGEMGLLGCAFHPQFTANRKYYVHYNPNTTPDSSVIEERTTDATLLKDSGNPPRRVLGLQQPAENHNGGTLNFGKDGYLYVGFGDGAGGPRGTKKSLLGAILRIDVDSPSGGKGYGIPADNPFVNDPDPEVKKEIWVYGLRNPWKWSFDPLNGDLWIGDVGQSAREEINLARKGEHLGWDVMEGATCYNGTTCDQTGLTLPVTDVVRAQASCIIGGVVYRGHPASPFYGVYLFCDHISRRVWGLKHENRSATELTQIATAPLEISAFAADADQNIYLVGYGYGAGPIYRLEHAQLTPIRVPSRRRIGARLQFRDPENPAVLRDLSGQRIRDRGPGANRFGLAMGVYFVSGPSDGKPIPVLLLD